MSARRSQDTSLDSGFSVSLPEAAYRADELVQLLEEELSLGDDPITRLARNLSVRTVISTASSFAQQQQLASSQGDVHEYREIGAGYCGTVFEQPGAISVLKKAKYGQLTLWNDYLIQARVHEHFAIARHLFVDQEVPRIPRPIYYIPEKDLRWRTENAGKFPPHHRDLQTPILCLERVFPLPRPIRDDLIDLFCPETGREGAKKAAGNKDCIMRLYLGRRRRSNSRPVKFFSLRNFSLHLDMAEQIQLDVGAFATQMAVGLALCHWRAKVDCNDVEFVLGSAPTILNFTAIKCEQLEVMPIDSSTRPEELYHNFEKRTTHLWMLDYDKCRKMAMTDEGVAQAIKAAEDNDPYFPKPHKTQPSDKLLWATFSQAYLKASKTILDADNVVGELKDAPEKFLRGWEDYRKLKLEKMADV